MSHHSSLNPTIAYIWGTQGVPQRVVGEMA